MLDGLIVLHAQLIHNAGDVVAAKEAHQIVLQTQEELGRAGVALTSATTTQLVIDAAAFMALGANDMQAAQLGHALAQHDISTTACHVGGDSYSAILAGQGDNFCFFFVVFSVQNIVRHATTLQHSAELLGLRNGGGANQNRLTSLMALFNLAHSCLIFSQTCLVDYVRSIHTNHGLIGGNNNYGQVVNLHKLLLLGLGSTGHTSQLLVHTEVVLEGDGSQSLAFALHLYAFLSFNCLVQALREAATKHQAAGEFINDDNLAILNHVIAVAVHQSFSLQSAHNLMGVVHTMLIIIEVFNAQHFFCLGNTLFSGRNLTLLFVNGIILNLGHLVHNLRHNAVQVGRFFAGAGNNQRGTRFVDKDTIHFVDDAIVQLALHHLVLAYYHVVTQVVKAELVIGAVGYVRSIGSLAVGVVHIMHNQAHAKTQSLINAAHVHAIAASQIVVNGNNVHALASQGIQIYGQGCYQGFAFAGTHFGDFSAVQHHATDELYIKMAHTSYALRSLAHYSKGLRQDIIQSFALLQTHLKFSSFSCQISGAQAFHALFQAINLINNDANIF